MTFKSKNMNYVFNYEYFEGLDKGSFNNKVLFEYPFPQNIFIKDIKNIPNYQGIVLFSQYPGLLIGIGNPHDIKADGAIKCGFSFDYTTGLPYLPGSSLKGLLRHYFPSGGCESKEEDKEKEEYIKALLPEEKRGIDVLKLKEGIFENEIIFIGGFPTDFPTDGKKNKLLAEEWITPHRELKNPNPISLIKVRPGVKFEFGFIMKDIELSDGICITVEEMTELFKNILLDMGIGAKTNVGFGKLEEK